MSVDKSKAQKNKKFFAKNDRVKFEDDHKNIDGWGGKHVINNHIMSLALLLT